MEGAVHIAVTSRSLFDGGSERLHYDGSGTLRRTAAGWDLPYSAACRENGAAIASRIRLTEEPRRAILWTLGPDGYGLPLDPAHETQARLPMGLTVTARTPDAGLFPGGTGGLHQPCLYAAGPGTASEPDAADHTNHKRNIRRASP